MGELGIAVGVGIFRAGKFSTSVAWQFVQVVVLLSLCLSLSLARNIFTPGKFYTLVPFPLPIPAPAHFYSRGKIYSCRCGYFWRWEFFLLCSLGTSRGGNFPTSMLGAIFTGGGIPTLGGRCILALAKYCNHRWFYTWQKITTLIKKPYVSYEILLWQNPGGTCEFRKVRGALLFRAWNNFWSQVGCARSVAEAYVQNRRTTIIFDR